AADIFAKFKTSMEVK
nr:RecName: Full=Methyl-coenzyme M reductase subunit alpha; AltName: Full=Coenzyme-B sulfoethylthiotransferase alpha [Methanosarcina thermophila]